MTAYLLKRRIGLGLACQLLETTQLSVSEVAARAGMEDASYFSIQFKRMMGVASLRYRKGHSFLPCPLSP